MLANRRIGYAEITGQVHFGSMDHEQAEQYRGQIVMNTEEELFFSTLTVRQTMDFATRMKVPHHLPSNVKTPEEFQKASRDFLLRCMAIEHTHDTKVGNEYAISMNSSTRPRILSDLYLSCITRGQTRYGVADVH